MMTRDDRIRTIAALLFLFALAQTARAQLPGKQYRIDPARLPRPLATRSTLSVPRLIPRPAGATLRLPLGFRASVFAEGLVNPRWLAVAPNGDVFCVESRTLHRSRLHPDRISVLRDTNGDGRADIRRTYVDKLNLPFGIAIHNRHLYVANTGNILRWPYRPGQTKAPGKPEVVLKNIPERGYNQHWTPNILFDRTGRHLYLTIGSKENVAIEEPRRGTIVEYDVARDGRLAGEGRIFASGLRNPVGMAFHPRTGALWATVNERDYLGDDLVPDFLSRIQRGGFYGWPFYYIGKNRDSRVPQHARMHRPVLVPDVLFTAHSAPLGVAFYTGTQFPAAYRGDAFVALHGSGNRRFRTGYKVVRVRFDKEGKPRGGYEDFLTGWMLSSTRREVWGRPAGIVEDRHGALLIADDGGNRIWRVTYSGQRAKARARTGKQRR